MSVHQWIAYPEHQSFAGMDQGAIAGEQFLAFGFTVKAERLDSAMAQLDAAINTPATPQQRDLLTHWQIRNVWWCRSRDLNPDTLAGARP
jgi:hypothetical protein